MGYCTLSTDTKFYTRYIDSKTPVTKFFTGATPDASLVQFQQDIYDEINGRLYQAGVTTLPIVVGTHPNAFRRLETLEMIGISALMEESLETRGQATQVKQEDRSDRLWKKYSRTLDWYCDDPEHTLLQGDVDMSVLGGRAKVRPRGDVITGYTSDLIESGEFETQFDVDYEW